MNNTNVKHAEAIQSNYQLKTAEMPTRYVAQQSTRMSAADLDSIRTSSKPISASKFGLEVICGASCAVGAM